MKSNGKIRGRAAVFCVVFFLGAGISRVNAEVPGLGDLARTMNEFAESMALALPFNASMGLNWSDAYIGRFFPSIPPSFGVGVSGGFTTMDFDAFGNLVDMFGQGLGLSDEITSLGGFPLPGVILEGRIGGFFFPFDMGVKVGFMPTSPGPFDRLNYFLVGADIRYALLEGGIILPAVSVGVGFNRLSGGVERGLGDGVQFTYANPVTGTSHTLTVNDPTLGIDWSTSVIDFRVQVSRSLFIITPYLGFGASHGWSRVSYGLDADIDSDDFTPEELRAILAGFGIDSDLVDGGAGLRGFSSEVPINGWSFRAFGGLSFNLPFVRLDLTGLWNIRDNNFGATLGARFQL